MTVQEKVLLETGRFRVVELERRLPDGSLHRRAAVRHPGAVAIVPVVEDGRICLIKNFRSTVNRVLLELPAGTLEPGEDPDLTAARELTEETGYVATRITKLRQFYLSPGILDECMHLYLATGLQPGPAAREPSEQIENFLVTWDEALSLVARGEIQDAKTLVGLLSCPR